MKISIQHNRNVQLCSYGLIASGYDLYDHHDVLVVDVVDLIRETFSRDATVKPYFAWARSGHIAVNPYWPRGSGVMTASLFVNSGNQCINLSKYLQHEQKSASNMAWKDPDYQQWISCLPEIMDLIGRMDLSEVDASLQRVLQERSTLFQTCIAETTSILSRFLNDTISIDELIFIPNVLLAPELTDFVHDGTVLYVLAAAPGIGSLIHELLHNALHDNILEISERKLTVLLKQANVKKLQALGYSWDSSHESNRRIVEESIVRCMTILLECEDDRIREEKLQSLAQERFIIPDNLSLFSPGDITLKKAIEFIGEI